MLAAPPNYKMWGKTAPVWIMRGFYPGTSVFFKLVVYRSDQSGTWVKASIPMVKTGRSRYPSTISFDGRELNSTLTKKMENSLLEADHKIEPLVSVTMKMPRCMSPKGVKIFGYEKPKENKRSPKKSS